MFGTAEILFKVYILDFCCIKDCQVYTPSWSGTIVAVVDSLLSFHFGGGSLHGGNGTFGWRSSSERSLLYLQNNLLLFAGNLVF